MRLGRERGKGKGGGVGLALRLVAVFTENRTNEQYLTLSPNVVGICFDTTRHSCNRHFWYILLRLISIPKAQIPVMAYLMS